MEPIKADRRKSPRVPYCRVVTLLVSDGLYTGGSLVGLVEDISQGGICVVLDAGLFTRGMAVRVEFPDGLTLSAWVCHCTNIAGSSKLGLSFDPIDTLKIPYNCFDLKSTLIMSLPAAVPRC